MIFAVDAGKPVGSIMFGLWKQKAHWLPDVDNYEILYIDTLYVAPEYRRLGIAKLLLKMAMRLHPSPTGAVCLHADDDNDKALSLYRSLGFKDVSFVSAYSQPLNTVKEIRAKLKKSRQVLESTKSPARKLTYLTMNSSCNFKGMVFKAYSAGSISSPSMKMRHCPKA